MPPPGSRLGSNPPGCGQREHAKVLAQGILSGPQQGHHLVTHHDDISIVVALFDIAPLPQGHAERSPVVGAGESIVGGVGAPLRFGRLIEVLKSVDEGLPSQRKLAGDARIFDARNRVDLAQHAAQKMKLNIVCSILRGS